MILIRYDYSSNHERFGERGTLLACVYAISFREYFLFLVVIQFSFLFLIFLPNPHFKTFYVLSVGMGGFRVFVNKTKKKNHKINKNTKRFSFN